MAAVQASGMYTKFDSMPNFRRVNAEYYTDDNVEKSTKLFRSSRPDFLSEKEAESFTELGIRSIIDCRSAKEYKKADGTKILDRYYPLYKVKLPLYSRFRYGSPITYKPVSGGARDMVSKPDANGRHFLINFFKINYIVAVYNRAPWYLKLYSLLFLLIDLIFNTGYRYFVRIFARNVLNKEGLVGQYTDMIRYSQNQLYASMLLISLVFFVE